MLTEQCDTALSRFVIVRTRLTRISRRAEIQIGICSRRGLDVLQRERLNTAEDGRRCATGLRFDGGWGLPLTALRKMRMGFAHKTAGWLRPAPLDGLGTGQGGCIESTRMNITAKAVISLPNLT